jgi:ribosomal-protein-alanine N-acetyltransferase
MATDVTIKPADGVDELRLCAERMGSSEPWQTLGRDAALALKLLTAPGCEVYIARADSKQVGHVALNMQGSLSGYIQAIAVAPEWRSHGIGAKLLEHAECRIFRESPNVFLCVSDFNSRAQEFYHRLGYERIGELKNYVVPGKSEFLMRKTIGPKLEFKARS